MAGRVAGKVAFITGAARGQGRSHAIRLAERVPTSSRSTLPGLSRAAVPVATEADLAETAEAVEALDRRIVAPADVRDSPRSGGRRRRCRRSWAGLDVVVPTPASAPFSHGTPPRRPFGGSSLDTNLTGVWNTIVAAAPHLIAAGGGSIICTSSTAGIKGLPFLAPTRGQDGVVGIARTMANELAAAPIRVNTVHPTGVDTPMAPGLGGLDPLIGTRSEPRADLHEHAAGRVGGPRDISNAVLFLASDESRYVTGLEFTVNAGIPSADGQLGATRARSRYGGLRDRVRVRVVGRERELDLMLAAVAAGP